MSNEKLLLLGLEGSNPLAFLAALGTLRTITLALPERRIRMSWISTNGCRPVIHMDSPILQEEFLQSLENRLSSMQDHDAWNLGRDLTVTPYEFRSYAIGAANIAKNSRGSDRDWADFACSFGCESTLAKDKDQIQDTAFRTMNGAGHQHFLEIIKIIIEKTKMEHIEKTLFQTWRYDDPVEKQTLRWDPADDVRRAYRWRDPSGDPMREKRGGMLGANRLAIEALPLIPSIPVGQDLVTTGFESSGAMKTFWSWPIWNGALTVDVVRSLLALPNLIDKHASKELRSRGITQIFRSRRLTVGKFRCFAPAQPIDLSMNN